MMLFAAAVWIAIPPIIWWATGRLDKLRSGNGTAQRLLLSLGDRRQIYYVSYVPVLGAILLLSCIVAISVEKRS